MSKRIIGYTTSSSFQANVKEMIEHEDGLNAIPLIIDQNNEDDLKQILPLCSGIILIGGADWSPMTFGGELINKCGYSKFDAARDKRELFIMKWAEENDKKILGLCRGMQGLGINKGLYLIPNIHGSDVCHNPSAMDIKTDGEPVHFLHITTDEFQEEMGFEKELVNSFHHQMLGYDPDYDYEHYHNVQVMGVSTIDYKTNKTKAILGIELIRDCNNKFIGSQFHAENDWQTNPASSKVLEIYKGMLGY